MGVNQSRSGLNRNVTDATDNARLIGFNEDGEACVWSGGYTFNVYDTARDWHEVRSFTSGELAETFTSEMEQMKENLAAQRMESEGFTVV